MCGVYAAVSKHNAVRPSGYLSSCLDRRGPDHTSTVHLSANLSDASIHLTFSSNVLALRGDHVARQPLVDEESGSVLCWNGEAWKINERSVRGNDAEAVLALLLEASHRGDGIIHVLEALRAIKGPFALVYYDKRKEHIFYGRDRLGRRSLLVSAGEPFVLSSVAENPDAAWLEVEADGCYTLDLKKPGGHLVPSRYAWADDEALVSGIGKFNIQTPGYPVRLGSDSSSVSHLRARLMDAVKLRVLGVPLPPQAQPEDARVAVLFSGGLDCTVLARLASNVIPTEQVIDLINVAFENPRIAAQHRRQQGVNLYELCPDRITGRRAFGELLHASPERNWRFVTVNIPFTLASAHRSEIIKLIHPHNTEMDLSIAYALYFAARGLGSQQTSLDREPQPYLVKARVLLSGLGADELFGGYQRHAVAFGRGGYPDLVDELKLDMGRLGKRNLGRDDRAMSHWGREVRFPYLDEDLVQWAIELPVWDKCDFGHPENADGVEPNKRILRLLAQQLGLTSVSKEKKRAIQFGARTAKMESSKVKGTTLLTT